jgi:hypothetical protein
LTFDVHLGGDLRLIGFGLSPSDAALLDCAPVVSHAPTYGELFSLGIHGPAVTGGSPFNSLQVDPVCFLPGGRFEFARDLEDATGHALAVIIPARDRYGETIDLAAWRPTTGRFGTWRGAAVLLGEDQIDAPRLDGDCLRVFPGPAEWLRAERQGVVILDPKRARWLLAEERLLVADAPFGRQVRDMLRLPAPRIFVERRRQAAA